MKHVVLGLMLAGLVSVPAGAEDWQVYGAEFSVHDGWAGEELMGYRLKESVLLSTVQTLENPIPSGDLCELKAGTVIHPGIPNSGMQFKTVSGVDYFRALEDFTMSTLASTLSVKKGDELKHLGDLGEGYCVSSVNGKLTEDTCLRDDGRVTIIHASPVPTKTYFKAPCADGGEGWMSTEELEMSIDDENSVLEMIQVDEEGKVYEESSDDGGNG